MGSNTFVLGQALLDPLTARESEILSHLKRRWSNREIAADLHLGLNTVKWYNQQIYSKLGVSNRRQAVAQAEALGLLDVEETPTAQLKHNLPAAVNSFIGRQSELAWIAELFSEPSNRLLTLTGSPGIGKTRLALQAATRSIDDFDDGVFFIPLAPIQDPDLVPSAIADALGLSESEGQSTFHILKEDLRHKHMLLLLDNFEHLSQSALVVSELLASTLHIKILVTSREVLNISGEHEYLVPPLMLPDLEQTIVPSELAEYEAVALFIHRARAIQRDLETNSGDLSAIAQICTQLDGLPLAIELAAAQVKRFPPVELRTRMSKPLKSLTKAPIDLPPRQQSLRNTIAWSNDLLDEGEKTLFARLGVFAGGCTLEAASVVCGDHTSLDTGKGIKTLMKKSLLRQEEGSVGEPRFMMLETIREFAKERLRDSGEADVLQRKHATYYLALAKRGDPELRRSSQAIWLERLRDEHANFRSTMERSLSSADPTIGLDLAGALGMFWVSGGYYIEGHMWSERALKASTDSAPEVHARILNAAGIMAFAKGDLERCIALHEQALSLFRELEDKGNIAATLVYLGWGLRAFPEQYSRVESYIKESRRLFEDLGDKHAVAITFANMGNFALIQKDYERARRNFEESLRRHQALDNQTKVEITRDNLALVDYHQGNYALAKAHFKDALLRDFSMDTEDLAYTLIGYSGVLVVEGEVDRGTRLLRAAMAIFDELGIQIQPSERPTLDDIVEKIHEQLDEAAFKRLWSDGEAMNPKQALELATHG